MTSTLEPSARQDAPAPRALDRAEGVELLGPVDGSGYREGVCLVRRGDGQMVQLGPLMYALLDEVDGRRTNAELATALCDRLGRACDEKHVEAIAQKLAAQGLLAGSEKNAPPRANPLLALRWKVLVTNPRTTRWLTAPLTPLFRPWAMWPIVAAFLAVCWFVLVEKGVASAIASGFESPELFVLVFALAVASAGFHELGHAAACRYGGATPGGMGAGIYMVWPAFYTDVTDSYRLPRRDRLRVDLGGIYFNAIVSVATLGVWLLWRRDALLLLIALQLLMMVKNLSPVFRSDGYHILADATGVPDLYAHIGPTLRRLLPWRRAEASALKGRARALVTVWVLVLVPVMLSLAVGAVLVLPRLLASTWDSGRTVGSALGNATADGRYLDATAASLRLLALALPLLGAMLVTQLLVRTIVGKSLGWAGDDPIRRGTLAVVATAALAGTAWALWPSGQYRPVRPTDGGTLVAFRTALASPASVARPRPSFHVAPGTHLALAMIPVGGATERHPAIFVIPQRDGEPGVAVLSTDAQATESAPVVTTAATETTTTTTEPTMTAATPDPSSSTSTPPPATAVAFPFKLPAAAPGPGGTQALSVNTTDGAVKYTVAYALVTIRDGAPVTNTNSAFAIASCKACTTVAVSFQVVFVVGTSKAIAPINAAGALNYNCPACVTTAIADQLVVTLKSEPTDALVAKVQAALKQLDALPSLGAAGSPAAIAAAVLDVQKQVETAVQESGLAANPPTTSSTTTRATTTTASTPTSATTKTTTATTTSAAPPSTVSSQTTPATTTTTASTTSTSTTTTTSSTTTTAPTTTSATTTQTTATTTEG